MSETMTVYFASRTGHVLGAVTQAAGAIPTVPRAPSLEDVLVRGGFDGPEPRIGISVGPLFPGFLVPASELSTLVLAPELSVFAAPLRFQALTQADLVQRLTLTVVRLDLEKSTSDIQVTVTLAAPVTQPEPVTVLISDGTLTAPRILIGSIVSGSSAILTLQSLPDGTYNLLALVRGHRPFAQELSLD